MTYLTFLPLIFLLLCRVVSADTISLKDGQEFKGVVVEDYHDRIVVSTENGEGGFLKKDIERITYDDIAENFVRLGAFYRDKGDYKLALYYYEAAYKINPDMKQAQEGTLLVTNMLLRKRESDLENQVALRQDTEDNMGKALVEGEAWTEQDITHKKADKLWKSTGLALVQEGPYTKISRVLKRSPAADVGIKAGDVIVSIWGKLIKYMQLSDVYRLFLESKVSEVRITIERSAKITLGKKRFFAGGEDLIGGRLIVEFEGLTAGEVVPGGALDAAGILKGDIITHLGHSVTRYMSLESAYKLIEGSRNKIMNLEMQRELIFWKR